jgi:hypothetical protein
MPVGILERIFAMNDLNDIFQRKVSAAAVAGWWTLLVAVVFLLIQWIVYLFIMNARPEWLLDLWGPGISWSYVQNLWFWIAAIFKMCVWLMTLAVIWLTLWARQLRKNAGGS